MKPIEELRAAHAATTQGAWETSVRTGADEPNEWGICEEGGGDMLLATFDSARSGCNAAFIALAHNEWPALLDTVEDLHHQLVQWESVFGHLGDTPDDCGNAIHAEYDRKDAEIARLRSCLESMQNELDGKGDLEGDLNAQYRLVELQRQEIEQLKAQIGAGKWEISVSDDQQYLYLQHDWAGGHGQVQVKAECEGYVVDIFDDGDNCVATTAAMYHELDNEE